MAIESPNIAVTSTRSIIWPVGGPRNERTEAVIRNEGATDVRIGGANITTTVGFLLKAGESVSVSCARTSVLYAVTATTATLSALGDVAAGE